MVILGIDPGTTIMGYGVISITRSQPVLMLMGTLDQRRIKDHYEKIAKIFDRTLQLIAEYKPSPWPLNHPFMVIIFNPCLN